MIILKNFKNILNFGFCNITIGVFDGLHLGHAFILKKLKEKTGKSIVITFENHPLDVLMPDVKLSLIYSLDEKINLLKNFGIDVVFLLKFDKEFSNISYGSFLKNLKKNINFTHLVVGNDVKIGKDGLGNISQIQQQSKMLNFKTNFIEKIKYKDRIISSSWIRDLVDQKNFFLAEKLLNRKLNIGK